MDDSLHALGLTEMATAIAEGSVTSVAATQACLDALDTTGRRFNAVVSLRRDQALEAARAADQARGVGPGRRGAPSFTVCPWRTRICFIARAKFRQVAR